MAWDHGMVEQPRLRRSSAKSRWPSRAAGRTGPESLRPGARPALRAERVRTQDELPTSTMIGGELDLDLLPVDIGRREGRGGEKEALFRALLILRRQQ